MSSPNCTPINAEANLTLLAKAGHYLLLLVIVIILILIEMYKVGSVGQCDMCDYLGGGTRAEISSSMNTINETGAVLRNILPICISSFSEILSPSIRCR